MSKPWPDENTLERAAWIDGLWRNARAGLLNAARDPQTTIAGRLGEALRQLGTTLQENVNLRRALNQFARRATVGAVASYGDGVVKLVSETIRGWDAETVTGRLEAFEKPAGESGESAPEEDARVVVVEEPKDERLALALRDIRQARWEIEL